MDFNGPNRVRERQVFFQKPSQELLYLRGGPRDKVAFGVLCTLIVAGAAGATYNMFRIITGRK
ncbi:hypothetical protein DSO57_1014279 [Entomophthora muscae]|uniref:Uncharacterized protein n=2 Tax=Entomophthora muscae TaxID=34485 RepID=A0ACC2S782_9FUNG|nr:hypothetical protein DSO57_1005383 [Entomophthora muscae]KAJ9058239.1 hypothetical protein DSO57_1014279 [Entomophthora muscae]